MFVSKRWVVVLFIAGFASTMWLYRSGGHVSSVDDAAKPFAAPDVVTPATALPLRAPTHEPSPVNESNVHPLQSPDPPSPTALQASADAAAAAAQAAANVAAAN